MLGWEGPFPDPPTPKTVIKDDENMTKRYREILNQNVNLHYEEEDKRWVSLKYDYDSETHKAVWYSKEREYVIIPINEDSAPYEVLYKTWAPPATEAPEPLWDEFKTQIMGLEELNNFIASLPQSLIILASALPAAILKLQTNEYYEFQRVWEVLKNKNQLPSQELIEKIISMAIEYKIPKKFIAILKGE